MSRKFLLATIVLLVGCGSSTQPDGPTNTATPSSSAETKSNLSDVQLGFEGDVVGVTTLAQFQEKYPTGVQTRTSSDYEKTIELERMERSFDAETKKPMIGGYPAAITYTFLKGKLQSISISRKTPAPSNEFESYASSAMPVETVAKELFGPPTDTLEHELDWETLHSTAICTRALHLLMIQDKALSAARSEAILKDPALAPPEQ